MSSRHQAIEQHVTFWDMDKYAALKALLAVTMLSAELNTFKAQFHITDIDFNHFHRDELDYLKATKQLLDRDWLYTRYIEALDELTKYCEEYMSARAAANNALTMSINGDMRAIQESLIKAQKCIDTVFAQLQNAELMTGDLEVQLNVEKIWEVGDNNYNHYRQEATMVKYRAALDELERSVVKRLFELSKLALSGTGVYFILSTNFSDNN
ncbi:hypothetical protein SERLA73DRAFT_75463 [Serpula lacrymans var. lacrymans S7.3]|uniref:Uncharacterized protein n=1 Tax=Serpula lacrymans var. lacrymans (strain S7.3) TaxID=936435 RepID=F8Q4U6_SERL3|nr:hypothetical protein SERLA73DRAFT_75463 [Serpula lacrymans var. lacrymans S7.3]